MDMDATAATQPFALSICARCHAPVLSSLVDSHRISCNKNIRPPSPNLLKRRASNDDGHQRRSSPHHHKAPPLAPTNTDTTTNFPAPPRSMLLYVGSEGFADDVDGSLQPYHNNHHRGSSVPHRTLEAGDAAALYNDISHNHNPPAPSSVRSNTCMADSIEELDLTARPPRGNTPTPNNDESSPTTSYAHISSVSPTRSSALRSFVEAAEEDDDDDGPRLDAYLTDWDTVLEQGSLERERLNCSKHSSHSNQKSSSTTREVPPTPPPHDGPPSLSDGYDRQYKAPSFAIASAALDSNNYRVHAQGGTCRDVFLPYLHNRPRGESTATKGAPLNHRPFMLVGKATVGRRGWGSDQTDQGALSKRRVGGSQVAARPSSAGPPSRGASANNRRASHMPAAPRMAATGATPLSLRTHGTYHPQHQTNVVPNRQEDIVVPETARALLHTADELDATFQEGENGSETVATPPNTQQFKAINIRGTSGAGKVIIHRPAMLLSPRKAPLTTRQSAPIHDTDWTSREVKLATNTTATKQATNTAAVMAADIPPPNKEGGAPASRVAAARGSSAHSRFVFPPTLRAMHNPVVSKRPSSVGIQKGGGGTTSSVRGKAPVVLLSQPQQSSHSTSPEPVPPI